MTAQHTQGRLGVRATYYRGHGADQTFIMTAPNGADLHSCGCDHGTMRDPDPTPGYGFTEANARRLAACWNAFDGFPTEEIEAMVSVGGVMAADLMMKKALAELEEVKKLVDDFIGK